MKLANLLIPHSTYIWENPDVDLTEALNKFELAYRLATDNEDVLFHMPDIWSQMIDGESFLQILANAEIAQSKFPWLLINHWDFLFTTFLFKLSEPPNHIAGLGDLDQEFPNENNGIFHLDNHETPRHVYDENSWYKLHWDYLRDHPENINWDENQVLPGNKYSDRIIVEFTKSRHPSLTDEEAIIYFETDLIRKIKTEQGELIQLATQVALCNGYSENPNLSAKESQLVGGSQRKIFKITKNGLKQYLSLDFENWQFEVCDHRGKHMGVWNFSGRKTKEADTSGKHDLRCLK